jgi:hypothetical protein
MNTGEVQEASPRGEPFNMLSYVREMIGYSDQLWDEILAGQVPGFGLDTLQSLCHICGVHPLPPADTEALLWALDSIACHCLDWEQGTAHEAWCDAVEAMDIDAARRCYQALRAEADATLDTLH